MKMLHNVLRNDQPKYYHNTKKKKIQNISFFQRMYDYSCNLGFREQFRKEVTAIFFLILSFIYSIKIKHMLISEVK